MALRTPVGSSAIDWKIGVWDTIIGYESSSDPANPNYTRSYGYSIEPTTHTGILGTYKINDMFTVQAGVANGSNLGGACSCWRQWSCTFKNPRKPTWVQLHSQPRTVGVGQKAQRSMRALSTLTTAELVAFNAGTTSFYAGATVPTPLTALKVGVGI